jgi:hypothetical protein
MAKLESMEKQNRDATPQPMQEAADLASALIPPTVENHVPETEEAEMGSVQEKKDVEEQREGEEDAGNGPGQEGGSDEIVKEEAFPMQEIESLCMRCGENVSRFHFFSTNHCSILPSSGFFFCLFVY